MKVLVIGREPNIFDEHSEAYRRIREYAELFDELHIVPGEKEKREPKRVGNLYVWPACSRYAVPRFFKVFWKGVSKAREYRIDVIDAQDAGEWGLIAWLVSVCTRIPFRLQIHTDVFSPWYRKASWKERVRYFLARFLVPRARCVRVVSERIRRSLASDLKYKSPGAVTLPIFTDISDFLKVSRTGDASGLNMVAAGRFIDREKNFSMLLRMMADLIKTCPKARLTIFGDGPDKKYYEELISSKNLGMYVKISPWTTRENIIKFYSTCNVYLMSSNFEGWGRVVIEAMAAGLAIVTTDVGLAGEVVKNGENGVVVPPADEEKYSRAVRDLCENPDKIIRLATAGRKTAQDLKPATKEEYLALYKESFSKCVF